MRSIPLTELMTPDFLASCSKFSSLDDLLHTSGFMIARSEEIETLPDYEWDKFIGQHTIYSNWKEMLGSAAEKWATKRLGF